jgi:membrane protein
MQSTVNPGIGGARHAWQLIKEVALRMQRHNSALVASGIAMYAMLSVFPGLSAAVLIYGLFATPTAVNQQLQVFAGVLPPAVWGLLSTQLQQVAAHDHRTLTVAALLGLLFALWSARLTMSALMTATNIATEIEERRGLLTHIALSIVLTLGLIIGFLVMLLVGVLVPLLLTALGTNSWVQLLMNVIRWLMLWGFAVLGLALIYHFAPARRHIHWRCLTWGATLAATFWLLSSGALSLYVTSFPGYDRIYGTLAGVMVLLMWFYLLSFSVVLGAEVNSVVSARLRAC